MKRRKKRSTRRNRRSHARRSTRRNKGSRRRKVSAYARFVGKKMRAGHSMKAAARMWSKK